MCVLINNRTSCKGFSFSTFSRLVKFQFLLKKLCLAHWEDSLELYLQLDFTDSSFSITHTLPRFCGFYISGSS